MSKELWVGVFEVLERPGGRLLHGRSGAFVNAMGLYESSDSFRQAVTQTLGDYGLVVVNADKLGLVAGRLEQGKLIPELVELARSVSEIAPVAFGSFYSFGEEE